MHCAGAFPGIEAEERGQGEAIARNLYGMSGLKVPVLSILIGEGGSGGVVEEGFKGGGCGEGGLSGGCGDGWHWRG